MSDQVPNKDEASHRNNPSLAVDDENLENEHVSTEDEHSSPSSLQNTGSEFGESSSPASAGATGDDARLLSEPRTEPDGKASASPTSYKVKGQFFFREDSELQSPTESKCQSNSSLTGSTTGLCVPPSPSLNERRPPESLPVAPMNLNLPTISVSVDKSIEDPSIGESSTRTKAKGTLGVAFNKLVERLSPRKEKLSPSDPSAIPGSAISSEAPPASSSEKPKIKKSSPLRFLLGKDKSSKDSPDKKKKSPSKFKSLVENALNPKKLFPPRCSDEASDHLCDFEDPPKAKDEKTKGAKPYWEDVVIPKDFKKVPSINFSDTTVDSLSTQWSFTTLSPQSDTSNPNQEDRTDKTSKIPPIPEASKTESDEDEKPDEES